MTSPVVRTRRKNDNNCPERSLENLRWNQIVKKKIKKIKFWADESTQTTLPAHP